MPTPQNARGELLALLLLLAVLGMTPLFDNDYWTGLSFNLLMWIGLASAWSLFSALTGFISLGHVVFFGLGTYTTVLLWDQVPLWAALPLAAASAAAFALLIGLPVLRVRGPYFVILTLGISELVKNVVLMSESALGQASRIMMGAPSLNVLLYCLLVCAAVAIAAGHFMRSRPRWWLGLRAVRANEEAAETIGIPVARMKLAALAMSALIIGAIGGVSALRSTYFEASQAFDPMISFTMIAMTIIGGGDSLKGPVLGAIGLTLLQEVLWANLPQLYTVILGLLLVLFVLFVPGGISGWLSRAFAKRDAAPAPEPAAIVRVAKPGGSQ